MNKFINKINCLFNSHKYGKKLFDDNGYPYDVCSKCGKRRNYRPKTLSDMDKMTMDEISKIVNYTDIENGELPNIYNIMNPIFTNCDKCGGNLEKVEPEKIMSGLALYECVNCKERCYK